MSKQEVHALKILRSYLRERHCKQIEFFQKKDLTYIFEGKQFILHNVFVVSFFLKPNLKYNLFIRFNKSEAIFYIPNSNNENDRAVYSLQIDQEAKIKNFLANQPQVDYHLLLKLGFLPIEPKPHSKFVKFLSTLNPQEINMTIEILKYSNLANQVANNYTQDYYDSFDNFINNLITNIT